MNRYKSREQAFLFVFESLFDDRSFDDIAESAKLSRDYQISDYSKQVFEGIKTHEVEIDKYIENNSKFWSKERLSKVALSILRLSIYEILFENSIPINVSINEAVDLAKKYGTPKEASYINGVLGAIAKQIS